MKLKIKQLLVLVCLLISTISYGQVPQKFNYQGIVRDVKGNPLAKQNMSLKISVLPTQDATVSEYEETQMVTTNEFGLYTLQIGAGTPISGEMKNVKWETGNKYIKIAIDQKGGTDYIEAGTTQLLSVPYAIYADKAGLARETTSSTDKTRTGAVSSNATHVAGEAGYITKFTALNTIGKSNLFENASNNVGLGTTAPSAKFHVNSTASTELVRMQSSNSTGFGKFTMYNDNPLNYATFTKYGSAAPGGYAGISTMFPSANLLAFGNNGGGFLISNGGNVGLSAYKSGTSNMKFYIDYNTLYTGIGGNAMPTTNIHFNNASTGDTLKITNSTTGHTATDGLDIRNNGNAAEIVNRENSTLAFGTNNINRVNITATGNTELTGQIKISGGTPGAGKVLTSDATGLATWETPIGGSGNAWSLNGNAATDTSNFIGTTDNAPLRFKINGINFGYFGTNNIAIGNYSQDSSLTGHNVSIGMYTLSKNVGGTYNTALGDNALQFNKSGMENTAIGDYTLKGNTTGSQNTAIGNESLTTNTIGSKNTALGNWSLLLNTEGYENTAIGNNTLKNNTTGFSNVAIGSNTLSSNTTISNLVAIGDNALYKNGLGASGQQAQYNTAVGSKVLSDNTTGRTNTGLGAFALTLNTTGDYNVALGGDALIYNTSGSSNVAIGTAALASNTTADKNVAVGRYALGTISSGSNNTALGYQAGYILNSNSVFNTLCLGYSTGWNTTTSNQVNIGNHSITSIGGEVNWGTYSDKRIKNNIQENVPGLAFISKLKPVTYNLDIHKQYELAMRGQKDTSGDFPGKYDIEKIKMTGFLAQDVEQAAKDCSYDFSGVEAPQNGDGLYKIRYAEFVVPLVKSVQELQTLLEVEKQKNLTLEARLKAIEEKLK